MGRILAIDYGQKRAGIAVTDPLQLVANGLTTVHVKDIWSFLSAYITSESVDCIVVGEPRTMQNLPSDAARFIDPFVVKLKKTFPDMKIVRVDERFTSKMAHDTMLSAGLSKTQRRNKELVDTISATLILQSYMNTTIH
jgi:putative Holliday junction resolvase